MSGLQKAEQESARLVRDERYDTTAQSADNTLCTSIDNHDDALAFVKMRSGEAKTGA